MSANTKMLATLDDQIKLWEGIVADFPFSESYKSILVMLVHHRQIVAASIGQKKEKYGDELPERDYYDGDSPDY